MGGLRETLAETIGWGGGAVRSERGGIEKASGKSESRKPNRTASGRRLGLKPLQWQTAVPAQAAAACRLAGCGRGRGRGRGSVGGSGAGAGGCECGDVDAGYIMQPRMLFDGWQGWVRCLESGLRNTQCIARALVCKSKGWANRSRIGESNEDFSHDYGSELVSRLCHEIACLLIVVLDAHQKIRIDLQTIVLGYLVDVARYAFSQMTPVPMAFTCNTISAEYIHRLCRRRRFSRRSRYGADPSDKANRRWQVYTRCASLNPEALDW
jgi:hypothetical protein